MVAADARTAIAFSLSAGNDHAAPHGRALLEELGPMPENLPLLMDRAYEGNQTRQLVLDLGMIPVVPPKSNRLYPWDYDRALHKSAMRSSGSSADLTVSAASFPVSKNSMLSFLPFSRLLSSSKRLD
jgi:hypothetical protein